MNINGTGNLKLFYKDEEGNFHEIYDATHEINESFSNRVIDKSEIKLSDLREGFSMSFEVDEDKMRMANAKDVTPKGELQ